MIKKKIGIFIGIFIFFIAFSSNVFAEYQDYDTDRGFDTWLSNSPDYYNYTGDGPYDGYANSFSDNPHYPSAARLDILGNVIGQDNFFEYFTRWIWNFSSDEYSNVPHCVEDYRTYNGGVKWAPYGVENAYLANDIVYYKRPKPKFINADLKEFQYKGYDDSYNDVYWVQPGHVLKFINVGYNSGDGNWLKHSYAKIEGSGIDVEASETGETRHQGNAKFIGEHTVAANAGENTTEYDFEIGDNNSDVEVSSSFENGIGVFMHNTNYAGSSSYQEWENNYHIKTDGTAPGFDDAGNKTVDPKVKTNFSIDYNLDDETSNTLDLSGSVDGLFDKGSGIKRVYAELYPTGRENEKKEIALTGYEDQWNFENIDAYSLFQSDDINVEVYTEDNVGNIGKIYSKRFDLLTVRAYIVPYNDADTEGTVPTLEEGQEGILKIHTTGCPDKLKITFPEEFSDLDGSLNKTINIEQKVKSENDVDFYVPIKTPQKEGYSVNVKAIKTSSGGVREDNPTMNVKDNILNGVKVSILYDNN